MIIRKLFLATLTLLLASSCSTLNKSRLAGAGIGAASGGAIGAIADPGRSSEGRTRNIILGTGLGAILGTVFGNSLFKKSENKAAKAYQKGLKSTLVYNPEAPVATGKPKLKPAKIKVNFVDDTVKGKTKIPAHFEYEISEEAKWED